MMRVFVLAAAGLCAAAALAAEPPLYKARKCDSPISVEMHECLADNDAAADDKLNEVYKQVMAAKPDQATKDALRKAERIWVKYRDKTCDDEAAPEAGGSIVPLIIDSCYQEETDKRIRVLQRMLTCTAGVSVCNPH